MYSEPKSLTGLFQNGFSLVTTILCITVPNNRKFSDSTEELKNSPTVNFQIGSKSTAVLHSHPHSNSYFQFKKSLKKKSLKIESVSSFCLLKLRLEKFLVHTYDTYTGSPPS